MKNTVKTIVLTLLGTAVLAFSACGSAPDKTAVSSVSASGGSETDDNTSVNENITTSSTYYEEPAAPANTGDAEGFIPEDLPEGTIHEAETETELHFTEKDADAYSVTIEKAEFTDRRSVVPTETADQVLLITYSYQSLNGEPRLVDDMSFRLFVDEEACEPYYVADQIMGDVSNDSEITAEVAFAVPKDLKEASLFIVDNAEKDNENYRLDLKF